MDMDTRIIVIDDEVDFLESLQRGLLIGGFSAITLISDPIAALQLLEQKAEFDVALIDYTMPYLSGLELLAHFVVSNPKTACIMVSAIEDEETIQQCLDAGACDYLIKPISKPQLIQAISCALKK